MPRFLNRRELIKKLRGAGLAGPFSGGKHQYMMYKNLKIFIPNPHGGEIGSKIIRRMLVDIAISEEDWEEL